eukprot:5432592-Amphidinium_carterae.1
MKLRRKANEGPASRAMGQRAPRTLQPLTEGRQDVKRYSKGICSFIPVSDCLWRLKMLLEEMDSF